MANTLYDLLEVPHDASDAAIQKAFHRLTQQHASRVSDSDLADTDTTIKMIIEAYSTLSDYERRSVYDASLLPQIIPARIEVEIQEPRWSPQKILLMVIGTIIAIGLTIQIGFMLLSYRHSDGSLAEAQQAKVQLREYEMEMGPPRTDSEIEEQRRVEEQRRLAEEARQREHALEESRRYAASISDARISAEESAKQQAEYAQAEQQRRKEEEELAIRNRLEAEKERLRELESQNRR